MSEKLLGVAWEGVSEEMTARRELDGKDLAYEDLSGSRQRSDRCKGTGSRRG